METKGLKIVFFGTPEFAVESLRALVENGFDIAAVVTAPDRPAGRGQELKQSDVKVYALEAGLRVLQPEKLRDEAFVEELRRIDADLFVVIAFRMMPEVVWGMPRLGTFNLHGSLLPRYRGAAPINRAVMAGETRTGVTTFFLNHDIDTGDVIDRREIEIGPDEDTGSVYDRLMKIGAELTVDTVKRLAAGTLTAIPQSDIADVEPCAAPKIFKNDCRIDWTRTAAEVHNLVRGLSPYPAAWTELEADGKMHGTLKVYKTSRTELAATEPGRVRTDGKRMMVDCGDYQIEVLSLQAPGKRRMNTDEFLRGCRFEEMKVK